MASEQARSAGQSELRTRVVSAAILAPVALAAVILGGLPFAALVTLVAAIAFFEWTSITAARELSWPRVVCLLVLIVALLALSIHTGDWAPAPIAALVMSAILLAIVLPMLRWTLLGFVYVAVPCAAFIILREAEPSGWAAILFILIVVWATDIAAYFGGRTLGGPKLWPRVSPKKTWSGALTGLLAAIVAGGLTVWLTKAGDVRTGLALALPISIAAQAGDLFESAVKRRFSAKDSGSIIPGHGGVLDRVDGLFGAAALAWLIAALGLGGGTLSLPASVAGGGS